MHCPRHPQCHAGFPVLNRALTEVAKVGRLPSHLLAPLKKILWATVLEPYAPSAWGAVWFVRAAPLRGAQFCTALQAAFHVTMLPALTVPCV